jgi:hypothetical protein
MSQSSSLAASLCAVRAFHIIIILQVQCRVARIIWLWIERGVWRLLSSGTWRRLVWLKGANVFEEPAASVSCLPGCDAMYGVRKVPRFRPDVLPPSSRDLPWRWHEVHPTRPHGVIYQRTAIFIFPAVRTSYLTEEGFVQEWHCGASSLLSNIS